MLPFGAEAMKRFLSLGFFGLGVAMLAGCPIYPDQADHRVCDGQNCYRCPDDYYSKDCTSWGCATSYDCPSGYVCSSYGSCVAGGTYGGPVDASYPGPGSPCARPTDCGGGLTCGADGICHSGDCGTSGCPSGYVCKLSGGALACVGTSTPTDGGGAPDTNPPFNGCNGDADCPSPAGSRCLDGTCVAPANQCTDGTQCVSGSQCVQGACTPSCDASTPCPTGYACDTGKGVCTGNKTPCGNAADAGACPSGTTCSQDHCVTPCNADGTCSGKLVCVDGGCVPNAQAQFTCDKEGTQDACASGSVCLHHSCYIACDPDAGTGACKSADKFNVCTSVPTSSGTYSVCGSGSNLGTQCGPTNANACTGGKICIDGNCR